MNIFSSTAYPYKIIYDRSSLPHVQLAKSYTIECPSSSLTQEGNEIKITGPKCRFDSLVVKVNNKTFRVLDRRGVSLEFVSKTMSLSECIVSFFSVFLPYLKNLENQKQFAKLTDKEKQAIWIEVNTFYGPYGHYYPKLPETCTKVRVVSWPKFLAFYPFYKSNTEVPACKRFKDAGTLVPIKA